MALSKIVFLQYNTYANRCVRKKNTYGGYTAAGMTFKVYPKDVSFNEGDGVDTYGLESIEWTENWKPDYCVVFPTNATSSTAPISRWFVTYFGRTRIEQHKIQLRRDLLADEWNKIRSATAFIEKATLTENDPLIFNDEQFSVNAIKKSEQLLKDNSACAWLVGYLDRKYSGNSIPISQLPIADKYDNFNAFPYSFVVGSTKRTVKKLRRDIIQFVVSYTDSGSPHSYRYTYNTDRGTFDSIDPYINTYNQALDFTEGGKTNRRFLEESIDIVRREQNPSFEYLSDDTEDFEGYNGRLIFFENNATGYSSGFYQVKYVETGTDFSYNFADPLVTYLQNMFSEVSSTVPGRQYLGLTPPTNGITTYCDGYGTTTLEAYGASQFKTSIPLSRRHLSDQQYDMFCIPYLDGTVSNSQVAGFSNITVSKSEAMTIAHNLALQLGSFIYDIQLLPFCPRSEITGSFNGINLNMPANTSTLANYTIVTDGNGVTNKSVIVWCNSSHGRKTLTLPTTITTSNKKIESQTDFIRIVSPNFNGQYEFIPAKNDGLSSCTAYYTYLPYNPFIQINPNLKATGIYRDNHNAFDDARGLCIQGDMSIMRMSDAFVGYEIQNKNFQNIFNRQIENMDVRNSVERTQQQYSILANNISAIASGASAGASIGTMIAPGVGTAIGAGVGALASGITSAIGGQKDYQASELLRNEALDYSKDMFGYSLGNIKAMPQSISKTTAFNEINKLFPIIEEYTCTTTEKLALARKIANNGMSVGVISTIANYVNNDWSYTLEGTTVTSRNYIKAKIINLEGVGDSNYTQAIIDEMNKGAFVEI